ncbi:lactoylglutathione lyase [Vibrio furnissii]|uniref:Lactoylglutathione lyase n=1 Tax=Vibrio furnissii TaxID=29494 RepID=A0A0Q2MDV0_VIBFU|nr:VOC family protein [Vibrio furnissii]KQH86217.1 lactoylglutathione lyase [Vibrio furnissii]
MQAYVEHANITVADIDQAITFLQTALPDFKIRHQGKQDYRWCHIGTEQTYIALQEVQNRTEVDRMPYRDVGINHVGIVVDDAEAVKQRLLAAGYQLNELSENNEYRHRVYFFDPSGTEWEFIEYFSDEPAQRNHYPA